ncbi:MAG: chloride channel protein [Bacteroidetes bacterium]|jgi:CIC family chloride channel protein|nr:chloride channel protein [Bacteroidota bacterium]
MGEKNHSKNKELYKFILASVLIGVVCAILGDLLKTLTEHYESRFFNLAKNNWLYFLVFPLTGLVLISLLRQYLFKRRENKGIREIYDTIKTRHNELPVYKIPSHFINGFLTLAFGGSTGIEVSTVVASASVGAVAQTKAGIHHIYRKELICAGVAAGVAALFNSPIAGALFALEVIYKKISRTVLIGILISVATVWCFNFLLHSDNLFHPKLDHWNYYAIPWFLLLGVMAGLHAAYLTKCVLFFKQKFSRISQRYTRILLGALLISACIITFPQLYGDGYHYIQEIFNDPASVKVSYAFFFLLAGILVLKPIATSLTLAAGGDGGIFGPSLFIGAFLGLLVATVLNTYFDAQVIPVNFMVIGMGAVLSASLHAPFTAVFLVCGLVNNYTLLIPVLATCLVSRLTAKLIVPYTVYSYSAVNTIPVRSKPENTKKEV